MALYPLRFIPLEQKKMWGKESWQISGMEGNCSVIANGFLKGNDLNEVIEIYMDEILGSKVYDQWGVYFPLLFKFIQADDDLSLQVHPNDEQAYEAHQQLGKAEMWYVTEVKKGAFVRLGFVEETDHNEIHEVLHHGDLTQYVNVFEAKKGDVFFIPAGLIHSLGKGTTVAEIQEASDLTYRLYDFNRVDSEGNKRELHIHEGLEVCDFRKYTHPYVQYENKPNEPVTLMSDNHFITNKLSINKTIERDYSDIDSFVAYMCVEGSCTITADDTEPVVIQQNESVLIPACLEHVSISTPKNVTILETYLP